MKENCKKYKNISEDLMGKENQHMHNTTFNRNLAIIRPPVPDQHITVDFALHNDKKHAVRQL